MKSYKEYIQEFNDVVLNCKADIRRLVIDNATEVHDLGFRGMEYRLKLNEPMPCLVFVSEYIEDTFVGSNVRMVVVSDKKTQVVIDRQMDEHEDTYYEDEEEYDEVLDTEGEFYDLEELNDRNIVDLYGEIEKQVKR